MEDSYGWYDLSVTCDASAAFLRRLAGPRRERPARASDPATAQVLNAAMASPS